MNDIHLQLETSLGSNAKTRNEIQRRRKSTILLICLFDAKCVMADTRVLRGLIRYGPDYAEHTHLKNKLKFENERVSV